MKKVLMLLLMISIPIAYAGSDSEEEKSSSEKRGAKKHVAQMEEEKFPPSQISGPQGSSMDQVVVTANQDPDKRLQDLMARISELEISNTALKTKNKQLKEDNKTFLTNTQVLNTYVQSLMTENRDLKGNNQVLDTTIQNATITIQGLNTKTNELELYNQGLNNQVARLNADLDHIQQELTHQQQANQALGTQVANLESEKVNLESARISLKDEKSALSAEIVQLKNHLLSLGEYAVGLESEKFNLESERIGLKTELALSAEVAQVQQVNQALGIKVAELESEKFNLESANTTLNVEIAQLKDRLSSLVNYAQSTVSLQIKKGLSSLEPQVVVQIEHGGRGFDNYEIHDEDTRNKLYYGTPDRSSPYMKGFPYYEGELIKEGYLPLLLDIIPNDILKESDSNKKWDKMGYYYRKVQENLGKYRLILPYIREDQAEAIRRLMSIWSIDEQWIRAYHNLCDQFSCKYSGGEWVQVALEYKYCRNAMGLIELINKGYYNVRLWDYKNGIWAHHLSVIEEGKSVDIGKTWEPGFVKSPIFHRNCFRSNITYSLQPFEPYVVEDQAKAIHRLIELKVTDDQVKDWMQAYKDFYNLGYPDAQGNQVLRLEYKYKK